MKVETKQASLHILDELGENVKVENNWVDVCCISLSEVPQMPVLYL